MRKVQVTPRLAKSLLVCNRQPSLCCLRVVRRQVTGEAQDFAIVHVVNIARDCEHAIADWH